MSSLTFYHDFLSQPARAVGLLLLTAEVPHQKHPVKLAGGKSGHVYAGGGSGTRRSSVTDC